MAGQLIVKVPAGVATVELMITPEFTSVEPPEFEKLPCSACANGVKNRIKIARHTRPSVLFMESAGPFSGLSQELQLEDIVAYPTSKPGQRKVIIDQNREL